MGKKVRYFLQGSFGRIAAAVLGLLPVTVASAIGGLCGRVLGRFLPRTRVARRNLRRTMPELEDDRVDAIVTGMWDNLGRVLGEFPHIARLDESLLTIEGREHIDHLRDSGGTGIFFAGHIANWEMGPKALALCGMPLVLVYRHGNNPILDRMIQHTRGQYQSGAIPKGKSGSRRLIADMKRGRHIGILVDQKMNDGISVKFFGIDAMTAPAIARLALRFSCPVHPVRVERIAGPRHRVTICPPLQIHDSGDIEADVRDIMGRINDILEAWIRERPAQWIWIHNRWPPE